VDDIGNACNTHSGDEKYMKNFKDHLGSLCIAGRVMLEQILYKQDVTMWTGFNWLRILSSNRQALVSTIMNQVPYKGFLDQLSNYQLFKKESAQKSEEVSLTFPL
jgi:hypothetical protein